MSDSENEEVPDEITEEFVEVVKNWVTIDDEIRKKTAEIKELKDEKKEFETFILEYMGKVNESVISISDGKLRRNKSTCSFYGILVSTRELRIFRNNTSNDSTWRSGDTKSNRRRL